MSLYQSVGPENGGFLQTIRLPFEEGDFSGEMNETSGVHVKMHHPLINVDGPKRRKTTGYVKVTST